VWSALNDAMVTTSIKMRRLAFFYCTIIILFIPRAAYAAFLAYASSAPSTDCSADQCDACQPTPSIIYDWTLSNQEIPAILSSLSSAVLSAVSVEFILTKEEKALLRTGLAQSSALDRSVAKQVEMTLERKIGLHQLL
jgi:hypothetical protein